jgi:hypothetical protein
MSASRNSLRRRGWIRGGGSPRVWLAAVLGVIVLAVAGAIIVMSLSDRRGGDPGSLILEMNGLANETSDTFFARAGWSIEWENTGEYFSYTIHGDVEFGQVITQDGPGNGITSPVPTGNFFIEVAAEGPWSIKVLQGD